MTARTGRAHAEVDGMLAAGIQFHDTKLISVLWKKRERP
jgi:hypothetical protein